MVISSDEESGERDSAKVALVKKISKNIFFDEVKDQLDRLEKLGPLSKEEKGGLADYLDNSKEIFWMKIKDNQESSL